MSDIEEMATEVRQLVLEASKVLAGADPAVAGAALADLCAMWLAGHMDGRGPDASAHLRARLLRMHIRKIRQLVPVNARIMGTDR